MCARSSPRKTKPPKGAAASNASLRGNTSDLVRQGGDVDGLCCIDADDGPRGSRNRDTPVDPALEIAELLVVEVDRMAGPGAGFVTPHRHFGRHVAEHFHD